MTGFTPKSEQREKEDALESTSEFELVKQSTTNVPNFCKCLNTESQLFFC